MNFIDRMPTGIQGLDDMIEGGLPIPSIILVAGDAGAGKTTLCTQFLWKGADHGEHGLYLLTFGGPPDLLFNFTSSYEFVKSSYFGKEICYVGSEGMMEKAGRSTIEILKMSGTSHHLGKRAVDISVKGLIIYPGL